MTHGSSTDSQRSLSTLPLSDDESANVDQHQLLLKLNSVYIEYSEEEEGNEEEQQPGNTCIGIHDIKPAGKKFLDAIRKYICTENAFPPVSQFDSVYIDICKRLLTIPQEKEITITDTLRDKFYHAMTTFRSSLYKDFKQVLESYTFDASALPEKCKNNRKRQFKYMLDAVRFARKDHLSTGAILQSTALGDIIHQVFYAEKGLRLVLQPDELVPCPVIALTFVYMYVNMEQVYGSRLDQVGGGRMGALRASIYHSTLHGVYDNGEKVDWEQVQDIQTKRVRHHMNTGSSAFTLVPLSSSYQPKYRDGVYVSDSDED
ncbi:hypothetical protein LRAMOSA08966 [Lichtheimia ramosa]|uniref:DUF6532 domain-containing protein n=1 Tax=Lichtheimia ramosa TaxID=688394 RepID=A0A077WHD5_9FUNG|nr:hypothetical protein LRAMOSA08966 [Lichtheimia ramosa]